MASGLKTAAWAAATVASFFVPGGFLIKAALVATTAYFTWRSHKQNQAEEQMEQASTAQMSRVSQEERMRAIEQYQGTDPERSGRNWGNEVSARASGRYTGV